MKKIDINVHEITEPHHAAHHVLTWWGPIEARTAAEVQPVRAVRWDGSSFGYADIVVLYPASANDEAVVVMTRDGSDPEILAIGDLVGAGHGDIADLVRTTSTQPGNYKREVALEVARRALAEGLRVFLSHDGKGDYGFFTDQAGTRVVSFQADEVGPVFYGNYGPPSQESGVGWKITDGIPATLSELLTALPPAWCGSGWKYLTTMARHLQAYGEPCRYREMTPEDLCA
jgi:hypothetical protein